MQVHVLTMHQFTPNQMTKRRVVQQTIAMTHQEFLILIALERYVVLWHFQFYQTSDFSY